MSLTALVRPSGALRLRFTRHLSSFSIPVIDFAKFRSAESPEGRKQTAKDIVNAFKESGFVYLKNHGVTPGMSHAVSLPCSRLTASFLAEVQTVFQKVEISLFQPAILD